MAVLDRLTAPIVQAPLATEMDATGEAIYGVNVFVPGAGPADPEAVHRYSARLRAPRRPTARLWPSRDSRA